MRHYILDNQNPYALSFGKKLFLVGTAAGTGLLVYLMAGNIGHLASSHDSQPAMATQSSSNVAVHQVPLGFRVGGRISQMLVSERDKVKKGDRLALLDTTPFEQALDTANAELKLAQAEYNNSIHIPTSNFNAIEAARANVETAEHFYDEARDEVQNRRSILVAGELDHVYIDDVQNEKDTALALARARRELAQQEDVAGNAKNRDEYRARIIVAEANVAMAESNLADTRLVAPADGVISQCYGEAGAIIPAQSTVCVLSVGETGNP